MLGKELRKVLMRSHRFQRQRLIPYRVLATMLYSSQECVLKAEDDSVRVMSGPLSRALRIPISRLLEAFKWLEYNRLIKGYSREGSGSYRVYLVRPRNLEETNND